VRLLQVFVPDDTRDEALRVLEDENIDYVLTAENSDRSDGDLVTFPLPTQAVDHVLTSLREVGIDDDFIVVSSIETARTPQIEQLEERYVNGEEVDDSIAREEIRTRALNMTPSRLTYYAMTVLSAVVATAGLLLDSPAIVVGSMVIAPQVSAALTGTVGLVLDDREMVRAGSRRWRSDSSSRSSAPSRSPGWCASAEPSPRRSTSPPSLRCKTESHRVYSPSSSASVQGQRVRSASRRRSPFHWSA